MDLLNTRSLQEEPEVLRFWVEVTIIPCLDHNKVSFWRGFTLHAPDADVYCELQATYVVLKIKCHLVIYYGSFSF